LGASATAGAISGAIRLATERAPRAHVDDSTATLLRHDIRGCVTECRWRHKVDGQDLLPFLEPLGSIDLQRRVRLEYACIVDENINAIRLRYHLVYESACGARIGEIRTEHQVAISIKTLGYLPGQILVVAEMQYDTCARSGHYGCYSGTYATRCARYQANFTVEIRAHFSSTSRSGSTRTTI
jgi:hypothetical protein